MYDVMTQRQYGIMTVGHAENAMVQSNDLTTVWLHETGPFRSSSIQSSLRDWSGSTDRTNKCYTFQQTYKFTTQGAFNGVRTLFLNHWFACLDSLGNSTKSTQKHLQFACPTPRR
eukprot:gnl/MRDRNA2_/MRDRNA2_216968_c0_seq1.p1 gnl/MRDRNA2_/MRDRNA2_216968_c0~~gnl/MRDRNA2_/MRDRNA2_216968_c0_seq1.p1  ORF type:complete len:115 (+),score=6.57 gnl/MRDRNA2_/MRDRNA2_216968_c0_seq1:50-394(+)